MAKDFDCSFSEVAAADQVTEVSSFNCFYYKNNILPSVKIIRKTLRVFTSTSVKNIDVCLTL